MTVSYKDVLSAYPAQKADEHKMISPYSYYVLGGVSLRMTPFFINRGVTANQVTALSLVVVVTIQLAALAGARSSFGIVLAGILIHLLYLLDNIDGHIARFCGTASSRGELFDALVTWVHLSLFPLSLGTALYLSLPGSGGEFGAGLPGWIWLLLAGLRSYAYLFTTAVGRKTDLILIAGPPRFQPLRNRRFQLAKWVVELEPVFLVGAVALHCKAAVFSAYALFWLFIMVQTVYVSFNRLPKKANGENASHRHVG